jgi:hypothetical protein
MPFVGVYGLLANVKTGEAMRVLQMPSAFQEIILTIQGFLTNWASNSFVTRDTRSDYHCGKQFTAKVFRTALQRDFTLRRIMVT